MKDFVLAAYESALLAKQLKSLEGAIEENSPQLIEMLLSYLMQAADEENIEYREGIKTWTYRLMTVQLL